MMSDSLYDLSCQKVTVHNDLRILAKTFQTLISQSWLNIGGKYTTSQHVFFKNLTSFGYFFYYQDYNKIISGDEMEKKNTAFFTLFNTLE